MYIIEPKTDPYEAAVDTNVLWKMLLPLTIFWVTDLIRHFLII